MHVPAGNKVRPARGNLDLWLGDSWSFRSGRSGDGGWWRVRHSTLCRWWDWLSSRRQCQFWDKYWDTKYKRGGINAARNGERSRVSRGVISIGWSPLVFREKQEETKCPGWRRHRLPPSLTKSYHSIRPINSNLRCMYRSERNHAMVSITNRHIPAIDVQPKWVDPIPCTDGRHPNPCLLLQQPFPSLNLHREQAEMTRPVVTMGHSPDKPALSSAYSRHFGRVFSLLCSNFFFFLRLSFSSKWTPCQPVLDHWYFFFRMLTRMIYFHLGLSMS